MSARHRHYFAPTEPWECACGKVPKPRSAFDVLGPYAGPCGVCGGPDKRHRLADAITENVRAGDPPDMVADLYDVSLATVTALTVKDPTP